MSGEEQRDYTIDSQQNLMAVVECLDRVWPVPQAVQAVAQETGLSRDQVFRTLRNLRGADWAEQREEGWLLSPHLAQISERLRLRLHQLHRRYLGE